MSDIIAENSKGSALLNAALELASKGIHVFPLHTPTKEGCSCGNVNCNSVGKHPRYKEGLIERGLNDATTNEEIIRKWWQAWPDANIGINCEKSGLVVLDFDNKLGEDKKKGMDAFKELTEKYPRILGTVVVNTGSGGKHLWYKLPEGIVIKSSAGKLAFGVDTRAKGGYVVSPPSKNSNGAYSYVKGMSPMDREPAELPPELLRMLREAGLIVETTESDGCLKTRNIEHELSIKASAQNKGETSPIGLARQLLDKYVSRSKGGSRNIMGFELSLQLRDHGLSIEEARPVMLEYQRAVESNYSHPYTKDEAIASLQSAYSMAAREPYLQGAKNPAARAGEDQGIELDPQRQAEEEYREDALQILREGDPIEYIIRVYNRIHVGDTQLGKLLLASIACGSILNTNGIHPGLSGDSGKGKSHSCAAMFHLVPKEYGVCESVSSKALFYADIKPGTVIYLDDLQCIDENLEGLIKVSTSRFQEGTGHLTVDINRRPLELRLPGRCTWWINSVSNDFDVQVLNRQLNLTVDDSSEQDIAVMKRTMEKAMTAESSLPEDAEVYTCRMIIRILREQLFKVRITYVKHIEWFNPENRRNLPMFLDLINAFAALRFMQRIRTPEGDILAAVEDYEEAESLWSNISRNQVSKLTKKEMMLVMALKEMGGKATANDLQDKMNMSQSGVYQLLHGRSGKGGLLSKVPELKESDVVENKKEEYGVTRGTRRKIYTLPPDYNVMKDYSTTVRLKSEAKTAIREELSHYHNDSATLSHA